MKSANEIFCVRPPFPVGSAPLRRTKISPSMLLQKASELGWTKYKYVFNDRDCEPIHSLFGPF